MRLMDGICVFGAKLLYDLLDLIEFFRSGMISNDTLKAIKMVSLCQVLMGYCILKSPNFPLIVEFVVQGALDTLIHIESYMLIKHILQWNSTYHVHVASARAALFIVVKSSKQSRKEQCLRAQSLNRVWEPYE
jgi:hypothetical protein